MKELTQKEICAKLNAWHKEGQLCRRNWGATPYPANTIASMMHSAGWLQEDLRQALIKASSAYASEQARFEKVYPHV